MADRPQPLLNPILTLQVDPAPETRTGGGKSRQSIKLERLPQQQRVLGAASRALFASRRELLSYGGKTHIVAKMFTEDSLAPSHTPGDLFHPLQGCRLVAPVKHGYLVEAEVDALPQLIQAIEHPTNYKIQADISRVRDLKAFDQQERLRSRSSETLWDAAVGDEHGKYFILWLAPFRDRGAQDALLEKLNLLASSGTIEPTFRTVSRSRQDTVTRVPAPARQSSIARAMRSYRNTGAARATVRIRSFDELVELVASGTSYRIDPVRRVQGAMPGTGAHPAPPLPIGDDPVVGVVDGGLHAASYSAAEVWRAPALVPDAHADRVHGNGVTSLVVHGHAWNNNRPLPALACRIGTVQAVASRNSTHQVDEDELVDYLAQVVRDHPDTKVWNISANQDGSGFDPDEVSFLGHEITQIARTANILPVISIGNVSPGNNAKPNPPADCEAGISVGGCVATATGQPGNGCPVCLPGPGPDGMMKPEVSWFSELRMIGGVTDAGSSYATPLVSSLAAHTFANLRDPSPDLVKALLINAAERDEHDAKLGWGTPYNGNAPWECPEGSVTLAWRAQLMPGTAYYWNEIPIPPEMVKKGKLCGEARLTAVLRPLVSPYGQANYFASRLETALQYTNSGGDWQSLLGSMKESSLKELEARKELAKWQPVRRHCEEFSAVGFGGNHFRLYARVYTRDLYQFGWDHHSQAGPQDVAFVLTFHAADGQDTIHDSTVRALGNFVQSAVVNQEIEIES
jgi:subtilase family protein